MLVVLVPSFVQAQNADMALAKESFTQGQLAFNATDYTKALTSFEKSMAAFPHFKTLFNIALCNEKLGNTKKAIDLLKQYLNWPSEIPNRKEVREKMQGLKALLPPEPKPKPKSEPEPLPNPLPAQNTEKENDAEQMPVLVTPAWVTLGLGTAGVVAGGVMLAIAQNRKSKMDAVSAEYYDENEHQGFIDEGKTYERMGWIFGSVGLAAVTVGTIMLIIYDNDEANKNKSTGAMPVAFDLNFEAEGGSFSAVWGF